MTTINSIDTNNNGVVDPEDWEEWDGSSPFWVHCVAGSLAGVAEHTLVYPLDTVRTHIQVCAACHFNPKNSAMTAAAAASHSPYKANSLLQKATGGFQANAGMWQTIRHLVSEAPIAAMEGAAATTTVTTTTSHVAGASSMVSMAQLAGISRLWRGVQTILIGCIPAHALYFSSYELVKAATLDEQGNVTTYGSALAGAAAVTGHDIILGPLDTVKQRLQLGHYRGLSHAISTMIANEGAVSLYRSFPVTLATNIPYGVVMVGTNEFLKKHWSSNGELTLSVTLASSSVAGLLAAALTTPLDRIKTYLQTQQLTPACSVGSAPPDHCPIKASGKPIITGWKEATIRIYETEGGVGFFRGMMPRILSHTPAVAISWTTYETAKQYLQRIEW